VAHFSKATLSAAASGHRLPTWEVTRAYVSACAGDVDEWELRWRAVRSAIGGHDGESELPEVEPVADDNRRHRLVTIRVVATACLVLAAFLAVVLVTIRQRGPTLSTAGSPATSSPQVTSARFVGGVDAVIDGSDPKRSGCSYDQDVTTLDSVEINNDDNHFLGVAELRHSPACKAAWGRFTPSDAMTYLPSPSVVIVARRPATATETTYETYFDGQAVFGNILLEEEGCVEVLVIVKTAKGEAEGKTNCGS
jgi:hypothetical protein